VQRVLRYDPGLQQKVNNAKSRRDDHKVQAERLERWMQFFGHVGAVLLRPGGRATGVVSQ
jgi:hypothetical protein